LSPSDLRHRLNVLRHKSKEERPGLLIIFTNSIPGYNRLDKLNHIKELFAHVPGYLDLNWKYHDHSAAVIVEFSNQASSRQALQSVCATNPALEITLIDDMRQLLNRLLSSAPHTQRLQEIQPEPQLNVEQQDHQSMQIFT